MIIVFCPRCKLSREHEQLSDVGKKVLKDLRVGSYVQCSHCRLIHLEVVWQVEQVKQLGTKHDPLQSSRGGLNTTPDQAGSD